MKKHEKIPSLQCEKGLDGQKLGGRGLTHSLLRFKLVYWRILALSSCRFDVDDSTKLEF
jgi:hypothetical protein